MKLVSFPEIEPRLLKCPARTLAAVPTEIKLKLLCALMFRHPAISDVSGSADIHIFTLAEPFNVRRRWR